MKKKKNYLAIIITSIILAAVTGATFIVSNIATNDSGTFVVSMGKFFGETTEIKSHIFDVDVQEDGSIIVEENITYDFNDVNGFIRDYKYDNSKGQVIQLLSVTADGAEQFTLVDRASVGDSGVYTFKNSTKSQELKIYQPTDGKIDINIKYTARGIVTEYNDMQLFNWIFYDTLDDTLPSENVTVNIHFPSKIAKDDMKVFAHGNLDGSIDIVDEQNVTVSVPYFDQNTFGEATILLPTKPLKDFFGPIEYKDRYQSWLDEEIANSNQTNKQVEANYQKMVRSNNYTNISKYINIIIVGGAIFLGFRGYKGIYNKFDKEKYVVDMDYYREVSTKYGPATAALVENPDTEIDQTQLTAGIFNLYVEKQIDIELQKVIDKGFMKEKEKEEVFITVLPRTKTDMYLEEEFLYEWLLKYAGEINKQFSYKAFTASEKEATLSESQTFVNKYSAYCHMVKRSYGMLGYQEFTGITGKYSTHIMWTALALVILAVAGLVLGQLVVIPILIGIEVFLIIMMQAFLSDYKQKSFRYTKEGAEEHAKMRGLKNYLEDYSLLNEANPSLVNLWEKYFVYGLSLGVTEKALNDLYNKLPMSSQEMTTNYMPYYIMNRMMMYHHINTYNARAIHASQTKIEAAAAAKAARTSGSSGFGGGGGFSGGGGFGGGGGGGRSF